MRVLIGYEKSGVVRDAFIKKGHDAYSCDIEPGGDTAHHYQCDVWHALTVCGPWDMFIGHPVCTYVCGSGLHWNNRGRGWEQTNIAVDNFGRLLALPISKIALENPVGILSTRIRPADQYIQPYQFGDDASKKTGLWLKNLPLLVPASYVTPRAVCGKCGFVEKAAQEVRELMFSKGCPECGAEAGIIRPRWANQTDSGQNKLAPSKTRSDARAKTYQGIANAMADQWGI